MNISNTCLLITTNDLDTYNNFPCLNVYDALREDGEKILWNALKPFINHDNFVQMMKELIKFFSIEGVASRLKILNPNVVIAESESIIASYESYYSIKLKGYQRLNLFMHLSVMIERLISSDDDYEEANVSEMDEREKEFFNISKDILENAEEKFNIEINTYEVELLYEIFKSII